MPIHAGTSSRIEPAGPTVGDIAAALASLPGTDAVAPRPTMLAGYEGRYLELTVRDDIGCAPSSFYMWDAPEGSLRDGLPTAGSTGFASDRPITASGCSTSMGSAT